MIFLRVEKFRDYVRYYPVTIALIAVVLAAFAVTGLAGGMSDGRVLLDFGGVSALPGYSEQYWRLVTAMFLHSGFEHVLFNAFALYVFAPPLERLFGHARYALFVVLCGVTGNLVSLTFEKPVLAVGISGAVYGLYGAYLYIILFRRGMLDAGSRKTIGVLLIIGLIYSVIVPSTSLWGHLGGLLAGFLLLAPCMQHRLRKG
ncbi:rhomboid family intramembrane serine protease [Paenibacillus thermoaerophilus]|uniref:Rhomboid family intramembrane serine protease n=1 Tax=Paenibacillus thermoaerophilus TaxID=1215385 RepID=A0ABW2V719_9BACL|nr:rhomboid family intramembrane serine protease [Paenibacillus thermoaerophilus]TMV17844.1 rhomboid family intramembrane serine protease [Paenibacillus thermoaerophilus]